MLLSGVIDRPKSAVADLLFSSTTPSSIKCLIMTYFLIHSSYTLLNGNLLPNVTWSTHTTLGLNHLPLQSCPALTAENTFLYELMQGSLGEIYSRNREDIRLFNLLQCWRKSLQAYPRRSWKTPHSLWLCKDYCGPLPEVVRPPHLRERPALPISSATGPSCANWAARS